MTRKDYRAIGQAVREGFLPATNDKDGRVAAFVALTIATRLADLFQTDNPRFNRLRFLYFVQTGLDRRGITEEKT